MLTIGPFSHSSRVIVAPMAGITDRPFRDMCRSFGSHWLVSEMVTSDPRLWETRKSQRRLRFGDETGPRWVQIAGSEPGMMAEAARRNVALGAQIIDINMGCPARKVCRRLAGSALLRDEPLVQRILEAVVGAVSVPVTLKMRLGWSRDTINAVSVARMAEQSGIQLLSVHGRTRQDMFHGEVDYDEIARVKQAVSIPVVANGDIGSPKTAERLLNTYAFDAVMIGRAARGKPWLPTNVDEFLVGDKPTDLTTGRVLSCVKKHVESLSDFYGEFTGVRVARKHVAWYLAGLDVSGISRQTFNRLDTLRSQVEFIDDLAA